MRDSTSAQTEVSADLPLDSRKNGVSTRWQQFWQHRNASEKRTLKLSTALLVFMFGYFLIYEPMRKSHTRMLTQRTAQAVALNEINALLLAREARPEFSAQPDDLNGASGSSLTALVDKAVRDKNMQGGMRNIAPLPPNRVRVELGGVNFDVLMAMLEQLEREDQIKVVEITIDTLGTSTVNAKVTLSK